MTIKYPPKVICPVFMGAALITGIVFCYSASEAQDMPIEIGKEYDGRIESFLAQLEEKETLLAGLQKENDFLKEKLYDLDIQLARTRVDRAPLQEHIQRLRNRIDKLSAERKGLLYEVEDLKTQSQAYQIRLGQLNEVKQGETVSYGQLGVLLSEKEQALADLEREKEDLEEEIRGYRQRLDAVAQEYSLLQEDFLKQQQELEVYKKRLAELKAHYEQVLQQHKEAGSFVNERDKLIAELQAVIDAKEKNIDSLKQENQSFGKVISELKESLAQREREKKDIEYLMKQQKERLEKHDKVVQGLYEEKTELSGARKELGVLVSQYEKQNKRLNSQLEQKEKQIGDMRQEKDELLKEREEIVSRLRQSEQEIKEHKRRFEDLKSDFRNLNDRVSKGDTSLEGLQEEYRTLEQQNKSILSANQKLQEVMREKEKRAVQAMALLDVKEAELESKIDILQTLRGQLERLERDLREATRQAGVANNENAELRERVRSYKAQLADTVEDLSGAEQEKSLLSTELNVLKQASLRRDQSYESSSAVLKEREKNISNLEMMLADKELMIRQLTGKITELENSLNANKSALQSAKIEAAHLDKYTETINTLKKEKQELGRYIEELRAEMREVRKSAIQAQAIAGEKDNQISELKVILEEKDGKSALLDTEKESIQRQLKDSQTEVARLKVMHAELTGKLHEQAAQTEEYARKAVRLDEEINRVAQDREALVMKLKVSLQEKEKTLLEARDDTRVLRQRLNNYALLLSKGRDAFERLRRQLDESKETILSGKEELENIKKGFVEELYNLQEKHKSEQKDNALLRTERETLAREIDLLKQEKENFSRQLEGVRSARQDKEIELARLQRFQEDHSQIQRELEKLTALNQQAGLDIKRLQEEVVAKDERIRELSHGRKKLQDRRDTDTTQQRASLDQIEGLRAQIEELKSVLKQKEGVIEDLLRHTRTTERDQQDTSYETLFLPQEHGRSSDDRYNALSAMDVKSYSVHHTLGVLYLKRNQFEDAVREFQKALTLNPGDASLHYNLGLIYAVHFDDMFQAKDHFNRYLELAPEDKKADDVRRYMRIWESPQPQAIVR